MPARSEDQQIAARMAYLAKRGKVPVSRLQASAKSMYDSMSEDELRKFAFGKVKK